METGTVKFFDEVKRFGFITSESGEEIFVHASGLQHDIKENDKVSFNLQNGKKGLNAIDVKVLQD